MKPVTLALVRFFATAVCCAVGIWAFDAAFEILPRWIALPLAIVSGTMLLRWFLKDIIKAAIKEAWDD